MLKKILYVLPLSLALAACSSEGTDGDPNDIDDGDEDQMGGECTEEPCLPMPVDGIQFKSVGETIAAGQDVEYCEVVALPGSPDDTYYVNRIESQMTGGSHHLIVTAIPVGEEGNVQAGDKMPCVSGSIFGAEVPVTGSQRPYREEKYPEGVGRIFKGGQLVVMDYHYFNTSDAPILGRAVVNMHTVPASEVRRVAEAFGFYNFAIAAPPASGSGPTESSFMAECRVKSDMLVGKLTRHTHKWGTDFNVWYAGGAKDGELAFTSPDYESDVDKDFEEAILVKKGEGFRFECNYLNTEDQTLRFGTKATDEMCILFGTFWATADGVDLPEQSCAIIN